MRKIAERAQVGDVTIYKYLPTKDSVPAAFFALRLETLVERLQAIPDFHTYGFREQLHTLLETQLELFAANREFLRVAYSGAFLTSWMNAGADAYETRERFTALMEELVNAAVDAGEFEQPPFGTVFHQLLWEFTIGVTWYWLGDESPNYTSTTQMIDRSLALLDAILKTGIMTKVVDLTQFLLREHLLSRISAKPRTVRDAARQKPPLPLDKIISLRPKKKHGKSAGVSAPQDE